MRFSHVFSVVLVSVFFLSGCASRGFKLSQQMPGMDNNLDPIKSSYGEYSTYQIANDGSIQMDDVAEGASDESQKSRGTASFESKRYFKEKLLIETKNPFVGSTLDPENGAILLNAGNEW